jgi:hypothetical protein
MDRDIDVLIGRLQPRAWRYERKQMRKHDEGRKNSRMACRESPHAMITFSKHLSLRLSARELFGST